MNRLGNEAALAMTWRRARPGIMPTRRKTRNSPRASRKVLARKSTGPWWASLTSEEIKKALDAVYTREDSTLDPILGRLQAETLRREDW